ncbi:MAG TPA: hypothetical protein VF060_26185 [Trebonia sp.]
MTLSSYTRTARTRVAALAVAVVASVLALAVRSRHPDAAVAE